MELTVIAVDIAKKVFQLHWVDPETGSIERLKLKRAQVVPWFAERQPALVAMEACGSAHEWGRQLQKLGHHVRLLPPAKVRPFVHRNKTDAADAQAIWTASNPACAVFRSRTRLSRQCCHCTACALSS
jgi:transposase